MYEIIDEKLGIASCRLADLTGKMVDSFLKSWGDDSMIGTLTLFRDEENRIVLNQDNPNYEFYLDLAKTYLATEEKARKEFAKSVPKGMEETIAVLEGTLNLRYALVEVKRIEQNPIDLDFLDSLILNEIIKKYGSSGGMSFISCMALTYGKMQGKRAERAKKREIGEK